MLSEPEGQAIDPDFGYQEFNSTYQGLVPALPWTQSTGSQVVPSTQGSVQSVQELGLVAQEDEQPLDLSGWNGAVAGSSTGPVSRARSPEQEH